MGEVKFIKVGGRMSIELDFKLCFCFYIYSPMRLPNITIYLISLLAFFFLVIYLTHMRVMLVDIAVSTFKIEVDWLQKNNM